MSKSRKAMQTADDIDLATLGAALWRAKGWILGLALLAGAVTFIGLSMVRPLYTSEARILIQNDKSAFTRPTTDREPEPRTSLDEQAVQSQVQVLTSRDLILQVVKDLDLTHNAAFAKDEGQTVLKRFLSRFGFGRGTPESEEERAANTVAKHLDVFQLSKSSVISVEYTSGDPRSPPRSPTSWPTSISAGNAKPRSPRPRTPPPGSRTRSRCCAKRPPPRKRRWRSSAAQKGFMPAPTTWP